MASWRPTAALLVCAGALLAPQATRAASGAGRSGPIPVRAFVDLQDPHSRDALERAFATLENQTEFALLLHHVPLLRHRQASTAAAAAHAARAQGGELPFVRALLAGKRLDSDAIRAAAHQAGLDVPRLDRDRADAATLRAVERERRAAIAFGVRATPTTLIGGRGLAGAPPLAVLQAALRAAEADWARCASRRVRDCERDVVRKVAPGAVAGLAALRGKGRGGLRSLMAGSSQTGVRGRLGTRWQVTLTGGEVAIGPAHADVTAVLFVDLTDATAPEELRTLLETTKGRPWLRLVVLPLAEHDPGRGEALRDATDAATAFVALLRGRPAKEQRAAVEALASAEQLDRSAALCPLLGADARACEAAMADTAATVELDRIVRLAVGVDARPGALYVNGKRWEGLVGDEGLPQALDAARSEAARVPRHGNAGPYARLVAGGRVRSEAEIDLEPPEPLGDVGFMVDLGAAGPAGRPSVPVLLFVDFTRPGSRAAFHALRMMRTDERHPVRLFIASIASSAEPGVTPAAAALLTAARRGKGLAAANALFALGDPYDWRQLRRAFRKLGISPRQLSDGAADERVKAAMAAAADAARRLDMRDEPILYIGDRRYVGPVDENRIRRAVVAVAADARGR